MARSIPSILSTVAECAGPHGEFDDTDGDGLINLHEYWAGRDPLAPEPSSALLLLVGGALLALRRRRAA